MNSQNQPKAAEPKSQPEAAPKASSPKSEKDLIAEIEKLRDNPETGNPGFIARWRIAVDAAGAAGLKVDCGAGNQIKNATILKDGKTLSAPVRKNLAKENEKAAKKSDSE